MPKATLEFSLPEEQSEFQDAVQGGSLKGCVQDFDNHMRSLYKYSEENMSDEEHKLLGVLREKLYEILQDSNINLFE